MAQQPNGQAPQGTIWDWVYLWFIGACFIIGGLTAVFALLAGFWIYVYTMIH